MTASSELTTGVLLLRCVHLKWEKLSREKEGLMKSCDAKSCDSCAEKSKRSREELIQCKLSRIKNKLLVMSGRGSR